MHHIDLIIDSWLFRVGRVKNLSRVAKAPMPRFDFRRVGFLSEIKSLSPFISLHFWRAFTFLPPRDPRSDFDVASLVLNPPK